MDQISVADTRGMLGSYCAFVRIDAGYSYCARSMS